ARRSSREISGVSGSRSFVILLLHERKRGRVRKRVPFDYERVCFLELVPRAELKHARAAELVGISAELGLIRGIQSGAVDVESHCIRDIEALRAELQGVWLVFVVE